MGRKTLVLFAFIIIPLLILIPVSAGFWENLDNLITGRAAQTFKVNLTVAQIKITRVSAIAAHSVTAGGTTNITFNFTGSVSPATIDQMDCSSAVANFSTSGETTRENTSCVNVANGTSTANFSCTIGMWYWDGADDWNITTYVEDVLANSAINGSTYFTWQEGTGFVIGPALVSWASIVPGQTNQTSNNDPLLMNNTYNKDIALGDINMTTVNLVGETDANYWIRADNFTIDNDTGGTPPLECAGSQMSNATYVTISGALLTAGNFTPNAGDTSSGQEQIYFCLREVNASLLAQSYSTSTGGQWTLQIT